MSNITLQANEIQSVSFHNQSVAVLSYQSKPYVAMKPITENLGLSWAAQFKRIQRHNVLNRGVVMMTIPSRSGDQQYLCLPLSMLNGWLFGIDVNRVKPELKDRLIQYQEECFEVLFNHFMPKANNCLSPAHQRHIQNVVSKLANVAGNSYQAVYRSIKDRFQVGTYKDISEEKYPALCEFLGCEPLEGEYIAKPTTNLEMVSVCKQNLIALINNVEWIYKYYKEYNLLEVSRSLKSDFAIKMHDHIRDGYMNARTII